MYKPEKLFVSWQFRVTNNGERTREKREIVWNTFYKRLTFEHYEKTFHCIENWEIKKDLDNAHIDNRNNNLNNNIYKRAITTVRITWRYRANKVLKKSDGMGIKLQKTQTNTVVQTNNTRMEIFDQSVEPVIT